jgi:hypothetical protein
VIILQTVVLDNLKSNFCCSLHLIYSDDSENKLGVGVLTLVFKDMYLNKLGANEP